MIIQFVALILSMIWNPSQCSLVIDSQSQKGLHISDYCPKMDFCEEGAHVMCMYYDPNNVMGPRCSNAKNISMTPDLATKLLDVSNAVRSKIALGKEKGKDGTPMPRGYGIYRLSWDEELATFAQVLANQCVLRHDLCRATKKFPYPGQATGLVRFTYPEWFPVSKNGHFTKPGLTPSKLNYAITQTLKTWYGQKRYITSDMLKSYPDWLLNPTDQRGRLYLEMISGPATHMGCGVSAYTEFAYHDNNAPLNYNSVQVVCNYSVRPNKGTGVYTMTPPTEVGYTIKCGCPQGYDEDADCLCYRTPNLIYTPKPPAEICTDGSCKPAVVLLPIFTLENAPPHKLLPEGFQNKTARIGESIEMLRQDGDYKTDARILEPQSLTDFSRLLRDNDLSRLSSNSKYPIEVRPRFFETPKHLEKMEPHPQLSHPSTHMRLQIQNEHVPKQSIFSRAPKFQLPTRKIQHSYRVTAKGIKKDVPPRKDFSNVRRLLVTYLNNKRSHAGNIFKVNNRGILYALKEPSKLKDVVQCTTPLSRLQNHNNINVNGHVKPKFHYGDFNLTRDQIERLDIKGSNDESDKKLMSLLDNLEQEVKHVELGQTEKDIFDAKIRKIYGTVVGKQDLAAKDFQTVTRNKINNLEIDDNLINYEIAADNEFIDKRNYKNENRIKEVQQEIYDNKKFTERDQDSLRSFRNHNYRTIKPTNNAVDIKESLPFRGNKRDIDTRDYKRHNRVAEDMRDNDFQNRMDRNDDQLSYGRRKYYQERLDKLERKLHNVRTNRHRNVNSPRQVRPVRPTTNNDLHTRPSKAEQNMDTFYVPDRARFLNGF